MTSLAWPLERNQIRRDVRNNAFGMVRNGGARAHQGWDLVAAPMTPCYAIADGRIQLVATLGDLGKIIQLEFQHRGRTLYAAYCHLSFTLVSEDERVKRGARIGYTGNSGNAKTMTGEDQHLHFEIRTVDNPRSGLATRLDPARLYGRAPIGWIYFEDHGQKISTAGALGLKARGINVREGAK
jgi:murein DD-endopeptidase MepM/ murein hydrolase activator NlpD